MSRLTLNAVNKAIAARGIAAELVQANGYLYFTGDAVQWAFTSMVMVPHLNDLGLDSWMYELDQCVADSKERAPWTP